MILFPIPAQIKDATEKTIASSNILQKNDLRPTNHLQLLSQHPKSVQIWDSLLSLPSHFHTKLIEPSGFDFDLSTLLEQVKDFNTTILLSENSVTSAILAETDYVSVINNSLDHINQYDIDFDRLSILGIQKHMCSKDNYIAYMDSMFNILRLSDIRHDYGISEVVLRESNKIVFDLNSIRRSDLPEQGNAGFCGFTIEEACRLMRYIGSVKQLNMLEISSIDFSQPIGSPYYNAISLLIWYMMEGMTFRQKSKEIPQKKQYVVYPEGVDLPLYFYNESSSDKWWVNTSEEMQDLIACSPLDYENARTGKYSDRLIKIMDYTE